MFTSPIDLVIVLAAVGFGGFYCWAQQRGLLTTGQAAEGQPGTRRISLLTEAAAYAGVFNFAASTRSVVRNSTSAPFAQSDQRENSLGEWLMPPMLGTKIMPIGPSLARNCAS